jgi:hypothetical protein
VKFKNHGSSNTLYRIQKTFEWSSIHQDQLLSAGSVATPGLCNNTSIGSLNNLKLKTLENCQLEHETWDISSTWWPDFYSCPTILQFSSSVQQLCKLISSQCQQFVQVTWSAANSWLVFCMISSCSINPGSTSFYKPVASLISSCLFSWQMQLAMLGGFHNTTT